MQTPQALYQHLLQKFHGYSVQELIHLNNDLLANNAWGTQKATFRTAVLNTLAKKGIDLSQIVSRDDGFTTVRLVEVELGSNNTLVPLH